MLEEIVVDIADALQRLDGQHVQNKHFRPGIGPFGEPQLVSMVSRNLSEIQPTFYAGAQIRRVPDFLIPSRWALEFKLLRPYGDNGVEAEHWSENVLHPYPGNVSALSDCLKLQSWEGPERRGVVVIGYEHTPPQIPLGPAVMGFELLARWVLKLNLKQRIEVLRDGLIHPVHQQLRVYGFEVTVTPS